METIDLRLVYTRDACHAAENIKTKFSEHPYYLSVDTVYLEPGQPNRRNSSQNLLPATVSVLLVSPTLLACLDTMEIQGYFPTPSSCLAMVLWLEYPADAQKALERYLTEYSEWRKLVVDGRTAWGAALVTILTMVDEADPLDLPERKEFILLPPVVQSLKESVFIVFDEELPGTPSSVTVRFPDGRDVIALRHPNHLLYEFYCPGMIESSVEVEIYSGEDCIGRDTLYIQSKMVTVATILRDVNNPVEFLCQALEVSQVSPDDLDIELTDAFRNGVLGMKGSFLTGEHVYPEAQQQELPTLLHLAARLGLGQFCNLLMKAAGGDVAMATRNKNGHLPYEMARHYGHDRLADYMESKVSSENLPSPSEDEDPYMSLQNSTMFKWKDTQTSLRRCDAVRHRSMSDAGATESLLKGRGLLPLDENPESYLRESTISDRSSGCVADLSDTETEGLRRSASFPTKMKHPRPVDLRLTRGGTNMSQRMTCLITEVNNDQFAIPERKERDSFKGGGGDKELKAEPLKRPRAPLPPGAFPARATSGRASVNDEGFDSMVGDMSAVRETTKF